jgi:hypothetical protein
LLTFFIFAGDVGGNALFMMERAFPIFAATLRHRGAMFLPAN